MSLDVTNIETQGGSALWVAPLTLGSGADAAKLDGIGTATKITVVGSTKLEQPLGSSGTKTEYLSYGLSNGVGVEIAKRSTLIDGAGTVKSAAGDAALHKGQFIIPANNLAAIKAVKSWENTAGGGYLLFVFPLSDNNSSGFAYLIGKVTGTLTIERSGNEIKPLQVEFQGLESAVEATEAFTHTALNTAITSITQPGGVGALHPATAGSTYALEAGDIDSDGLLSGKFLLKPAA